MTETAGPDLIGWDVLAVGRRQTHFFVTFGSPEPIRAERTLWIDTSFEVDSGGVTKRGGVGELEPLVTLTVEAVSSPGGELVVTFDEGSKLRVSREPNDPLSDVWYLEPGD